MLLILDLDTVLTLRKRLHYLSAYLETCGRARSVRESVARALYPRDYLATDANMFSVRDLQEIKSGQVRERQSREGRVSSRDVVHRFNRSSWLASFGRSSSWVSTTC